MIFDAIPWDHPLVQQAGSYVMQSMFASRRVQAASVTQERLDQHMQRLEAVAAGLSAGQVVAQPVPLAAPAPTQQGGIVAEPYSRYAPDMDVSVGCIPCTFSHLSTVSGASKKATATEDAAQQRRLLAEVSEEFAALKALDWTPDKIARTPEPDRSILEGIRPQVDALQEQVALAPEEVATASGLLKESLRFARSDGMQHPEVMLRMRLAEEELNVFERVTAAPENLRAMPAEQARQVRDALTPLREVRQDLTNQTFTYDALEAVSARLGELHVALYPQVPPPDVQEVARQADALNANFRTTVLQTKLAARKGAA